MTPKHTHKVYCSIAQTGQDSRDRLFTIAMVLTDGCRNELEGLLEAIEKDSGKKTTWRKTRNHIRTTYTQSLLQETLPARIYVRTYYNTAGGYDELTAIATWLALYLHEHLVEHYKVTIAVAGLSKSLARRYGHLYRLLGIKLRNVHGERTESSPMIRLADAITGLVREAIEGNNEYVLLKEQLQQKHLLTEI